MKPIMVAICFLRLVLGASLVRADGGSVCVKQPVGTWIVSVFVAPVPVRAGSVDVSVMVQDAQAQTPVLDADVVLHVFSHDLGAQPLELAATRAQATNKLLYAAQFALPAAGAWNIRATVARGGDHAQVGCDLVAEAALPPLLVYWPYLALPPVVIALFALHQWLSRDRPGPRTRAAP